MDLADDATGSREISAVPIESAPIEVTAAPEDRAAAAAALDAILTRGIRWPDPPTDALFGAGLTSRWRRPDQRRWRSPANAGGVGLTKQVAPA